MNHNNLVKLVTDFDQHTHQNVGAMRIYGQAVGGWRAVALLDEHQWTYLRMGEQNI